MTLEEEFAERYGRFHENIRKSWLLLSTYPRRELLKSFSVAESAVPQMTPCFTQLLPVKDSRALEVLKGWKTPVKVLKAAKEIHKDRPDGHLAADVVWTFWKYSHVVYMLKQLQENLHEKVVLEQAIVTSCTAFECFLREMIPWILRNYRASAEKYLGSLNRPMKELGKYQFDPIGNVDKIFLDETSNRQMPVFPDLAQFYEGIIGVRLYTTKKQRDFLERVFETRHCIVHTGSKPDARWRARTRGAKYVVDRRLAENAIVRIDDRLHRTSIALYDLLSLDVSKAPFKISAQKEQSKHRGWSGQVKLRHGPDK